MDKRGHREDSEDTGGLKVVTWLREPGRTQDDGPRTVDLGLDISTTTVGWVVMDQKTHLTLTHGWLDLSKVEGFWKKVDLVERFMRDLRARPLFWGWGNIFVEVPAKMFQKGKSSAGTLTLLNQFNAVCCSKARDIFSATPLYVHVNTARKTLGIKVLQDKKTFGDTKEQVLTQVIKHPAAQDLSWRFHKAPTGRRKGETVPDKQCEDVADAWVVCYHGQHLGGKDW